MPRKKIIRIDDKPYHVFNRVIDRKFYGLDIAEVWEVYQEAAAFFCPSVFKGRLDIA